ncbi:helix-turn-helix domain-containing protein [Marinibaculum pumilum]|uniref:Helix-turn-helix domain-containing protein n=1 Tax=Marinibaculum pumilum TaxID=1766165 RepID=A0ABV7LAP6_9PROT
MTRTPIGMRVRERRKSLRLTQTALAERLAISVSYLNLIEHNKRKIGGRLLLRLCEELQVDMEWLDGAAERRLIGDLEELAAEPLLAHLAPDPAAGAELVGRYPDWSAALVALHRAYLERNQTVAALSDRLTQDPALRDAMHRMLSTIAAIRSSAEILDSVDDLEPDQARRFHSIIAEESGRLSEVAGALTQFLERAPTETRSITPVEEVDDFIIQNDNRFPLLDEAAEDLRRSLGATLPAMEPALAERLEVRGKARPALPEGAPASARRFALAMAVADAECGEAIAAQLAETTLLTSVAARRRGLRALTSYLAAALLFPYDAFLEDAQRLAYDIDLLRRKYNASIEQVCHRLVTLRRPGAEGVPFGFMRADPAGFISKRFPLPRLPLPRYGGACPLWAVYRAFQTPESFVPQHVAFPGGDRFLFVARAVAKAEGSFDRPRGLLSVMLACDAVYADRIVYARGLDMSQRAPALPVGTSCRICTRTDCATRQEDPIVNP